MINTAIIEDVKVFVVPRNSYYVILKEKVSNKY